MYDDYEDYLDAMDEEPVDGVGLTCSRASMCSGITSVDACADRAERGLDY